MSTGSERPAFDPHAILTALQQERVQFILIGALARVIQGSDELTDGLDLTPSIRPENIERLEAALEHLKAAPAGRTRLAGAASAPERHSLVPFESRHGHIRIVLRPAGTRGYDDLRRKSALLHLGEGVRAQVAAPGDLVRMLEARNEPSRERTIAAMRRVVELDRGHGLEI